MTAVLAASGRDSTGVLERLRQWSRAGYVAPFVWAGADGTVALVAGGNATSCGLDDALAGRAVDAYVVGVALPDDRNAIGATQLAHAESVQRAVERAAPGSEVPPPTLLCFPVDDLTKIEPPAEGIVRGTIVVVPEDLADPRDSNHFDRENHGGVAAHVAHAVACLTGALSVAGGPFLDPGPEDPRDTTGAVSLVRCHSRVVDAGFLLDALAVKAFTSRQAWPNPDPGKFQPDGLSDRLVDLLVDRYVERHADVLGLRKIEPLELVKEKRMGLLAAIKAILRFLWAELRARPLVWVDRRMERFWDGTVVKNVEKLGAGSGVRVVRWHEQPEEMSSAEFMARQLPAIVPAADGATGVAWREMVQLAAAVVDGHELPFPAPELVRGERRVIETRPGRVVPNPVELPPLEGVQARACDPLKLDPAIRDLLAGATSRTAAPPEQATPDADDREKGRAGEPAPEPPDRDRSAQVGDGPEDPVAQARREQVSHWYEIRGSSVIWRIGQRIADAIAQAEAESAAPALEEWGKLDQAIVDNEKEGRRLARRRRRWLIVRSLLTLAVGGGLVASNLPTLLKPIGVALVLLIWLVTLVRGWLRGKSRATEKDKEVARRSEELAHQALVAAVRSGDAERLKARYPEYLDWAEITGHFVHRPWVAQSTPYAQPDEVVGPPDPTSLPAACRVGYAIFDDLDLRKIAAIGETTAFRPGWLTGLITETLETAAEGWLGLHPAPGSSSRAVPNPFGDTPGVREHVLEAVRAGRGRAIDESGLAQDFADKIGTQSPEALLSHIADSATTNEAPLPAAPEWFSSPEGLEQLAAEAGHLVVSVTGRVAGGAEAWRGSGVIVSSNGLIATCRHCVEMKSGEQQLFVATSDTTTVPAEVVAVADDADLALVRASGDTTFSAASLGTSRELAVGTPVFTLGYPFFASESGGPSLSWGIVTAPHRMIAGDSGALETRIQTNYPAGAGASGSPVFDFGGRLVGIHIGGYSERGSEERSSHISFAAPVDRLLELIAEVQGQSPEPVAAQFSAPTAATKDTTAFSEFIRPLTDDSETLLGDHGALSTNARRALNTWLSPAVRRARNDTQRQLRISLVGALGRPLTIGEPIRISAVRIDQSDTFFTGKRGGPRGDRLPWFVAPEPPHAPAAADGKSPPAPTPTPVSSSVEDLGSI